MQKTLVIIHTTEDGKKTVYVGGRAHEFKQLDRSKTGTLEKFEVDAIDMIILSSFNSRDDFTKIM